MQVRDVTGKPPVQIRSDATIAEAAQLMDRFGVGAVVVVDPETDEAIGIVTDRDVVVRGVARRLPNDERVDSMMSTDIVSISADDDIRQAYNVFAAYPYRRLPVLDGGQFVGMLTVDDLLVYLAGNLETLASDLGDLTRSVTTQLATPRLTPPPHTR